MCCHWLQDVPALLFHGIFPECGLLCISSGQWAKTVLVCNLFLWPEDFLSLIHMVLDCISPLIVPLPSVSVQWPWSLAILCVVRYWLWMRRAQLLLIEMVSTDSTGLFYRPRVGEGDTCQMLWKEWRRLIGLKLQTKQVCDWKRPALHTALCPRRRQIRGCQVHYKPRLLPWPLASLSFFVFDKPINDVPGTSKNWFHITKFCPLDICFVYRKKKWERSSSVWSWKWYVSLKAFSIMKTQSTHWGRKLPW